MTSLKANKTDSLIFPITIIYNGLTVDVFTISQSDSIMKQIKKDRVVIKGLESNIIVKDSLFNQLSKRYENTRDNLFDCTTLTGQIIESHQSQILDKDNIIKLEREEKESLMLELRKIKVKTKFDNVMNFGWKFIKVKNVIGFTAGFMTYHYIRKATN